MKKIRKVHTEGAQIENVVLRKFFVGDTFGEMALVGNDKRTTTAVAASEAVS